MKKTDKIFSANHGILICKMEEGKYRTKTAIPNLIRYVLRSEGSSKAGKSDVLCSGAYGAIDFLGERLIIKQFNQVSSLNTRNAEIKRYIDHQIFEFSEITEQILQQNPQMQKEICSDMTSILSDDQYQIVYALHTPDEDSKHLHVHFAVNTVSFTTALKRQEYWHNTDVHLEKMDAYLEKKLKQ